MLVLRISSYALSPFSFRPSCHLFSTTSCFLSCRGPSRSFFPRRFPYLRLPTRGSRLLSWQLPSSHSLPQCARLCVSVSQCIFLCHLLALLSPLFLNYFPKLFLIVCKSRTKKSRRRCS